MDKGIIIVVDPRGRIVHLPSSLSQRGELNQSLAYTEGLKKAIQAPACIIELSGGEVFYFRSVSRNITVLIRVILQNGIWRAMECIENPDPEFIQNMLRKGTFIAGSSMS